MFYWVKDPHTLVEILLCRRFFDLKSVHLFTCSALLSTSGRVWEAQLWLGGRRYIRPVYTAQRSDMAIDEEEQHLEKSDGTSGLVHNVH